MSGTSAQSNPQFLDVAIIGAPPYIPKLRIATLSQPARDPAKPGWSGCKASNPR